MKFQKTFPLFLSAALCCATLASCAPAAMAAAVAARGVAIATPQPRSKLTVLDKMYLSPGEDQPEAIPVSLDLETAFRPMAAQGLSIPSAFRITRPDEKLTTTYESYFITGTSDPGQPVYFGGAEIQRLGTSGVFGVLVNLTLGSNTFTFSQGGESHTVVIERKKPGVALIAEIKQDSMVPAVFSGAQAGGTLTVGCTAPYGATVRASFGGNSVTLKPDREDVVKGYPVSYTGKLAVGGGYDPDITQKAGKVTYEMNYNGAAKTYQSTGEVYVAGEDSTIAVEVTAYHGFVYSDPNNLNSIRETVKTGARDYGKSQNNTYYEISSGGFIPKEQLKIVEGEVRVANKLSEVSSSIGNSSEVFTFTGSMRPVYDTKISDNTLYLTLYNTAGTPGADVSGSRLLASASSQTGEDGAITYRFPLKGRIWGYDIAFDGGNTLLTLQYKPSSIRGMTIVLDPGHGGTDPGALGLAGKTGPAEKDVNLANAFAVRDKLTSLGANVVMTRTGDSTLSLDDRMRIIESSKADLFISLHHNSIGENVDANKVSGMEVYYHTGLSKSFADNMMGGLSTNLNRNNRTVKQSIYRVTLMPYSPALLVELGFLSNPIEYEKAVSGSEMEKVAAAVADGIQRAIT